MVDREDQSRWLIAWIVVLIFLAVDVVWFPVSKLSFAPANLEVVSASIFVSLTSWAAAAYIKERLAYDKERIALVIIWIADAVTLLAHVALVAIGLGATGVTFSYLVSSIDRPFMDAGLASVDAMFGFDWRAFIAWTNTHPMLVSAIRFAYHTTAHQLFVLVIFLSFMRDRAALSETMAILAVTSLCTGIGLALVPAEGAYAYFKPAAETVSHYSARSGMWHHAILTNLRTNPATVLNFSQTEGLVTFPSFHTVLALLTSYAVRKWVVLFVPVAALNALVIVGTIAEGGHYLTDIFAGAAIFVFAALFVMALGKRRAGQLNVTFGST